MNWQKKTPEGQTLYRTLSLHIHGGGKIKEEKKKKYLKAKTYTIIKRNKNNIFCQSLKFSLYMS